MCAPPQRAPAPSPSCHTAPRAQPQAPAPTRPSSSHTSTLPPPSLAARRVLPEHGTISDAEWEVAHTYLAFAFRRLDPNGETVTRLPPPLSSSGATRRVTEADILWLEGGDGLTAAPAAPAAPAAAAPAHAPASRKRERGPAGAESGRPAKAANAGAAPPPNIHAEQDTLFE